MATIIQNRHDSSNAWAVANPILAQGEIGLETDTKKFKVGDGTTSWNNLAYYMGDIPTKTSDLINDSGYITKNVNDLVNYKTSSAVETAIGNEATARENADNNLQSQIDAISASSDVTDIVGTYAELQSYDTSGLKNNSIIKVLQDESRDDEITYYHWVITNGTGAWVLIGEEGPYYTKSEVDSTFVAQTTTINGKPLSSSITLNASDVSALPSNTQYQTPITNENMLSADLVDDASTTNKFVTSNEKAIWNAKQDTISDLATIRSGASAGATAVQPSQLGTAAYEPTTAFATAAQGTKADSAIQGVQVNGSDLTPDANKKVNIDLSAYENKETIQTLSATDSITLADNTIYNGGAQTALTISLPSTVGVSFLSEIDFTSSTTATTLTYPNTLLWDGEDCSNNVFTPVVSKRYTCIIFYDGTYWRGIVKGVAV